MKSRGDLVRLRGVEFAYDSARFSLNVGELTLAAGERVACTGASGSGKTTLLELIAGLLSAQRGRVEFRGRSWLDLSERDRQHVRLSSLGLVFQGFELLGALTLEENILMPLRFLGRPTKPEAGRALDLMERLGIRHLAGQKPARLSFGERQRAAVCRALITGPELVLADEPTANLDPESAARTLELLLENSRTTGSSLFLISHDKGHAGLVDRVLRMESLAQGAPA